MQLWSAMNRTIDKYLRGDKLYGDDFELSEIVDWFENEKEGYAGLGAKDASHYTYVYHAINLKYGFRYLPKIRFKQVLGMGSAYGDEFKPIIKRIDHITVVEPSDAFYQDSICGVPSVYIKPNIDGTLPFVSDYFDLVTCFGVLHHIPNISKVVQEVHRCLKPGGFLLIREPIVSMGDWTKERRGLTRNERGIPLSIFYKILAMSDFRIINEKKCFFPLVPRLTFLFKNGAYNSHLGVLLDRILSVLFVWNYKYHPQSNLDKFRPTCIYFVLQK